MLKRYGARVTSTKSAKEALRVFEGELPDVMISDIGMPDQDGYELIRKLRALPIEQGGAVPAIALTGYASRKDREIGRASCRGKRVDIGGGIVIEEIADL